MLLNLKKNSRHFYKNILFIFSSKAIKDTSYSSDKCMTICLSAGPFKGGNVKKKTIILSASQQTFSLFLFCQGFPTFRCFLAWHYLTKIGIILYSSRMVTLFHLVAKRASAQGSKASRRCTQFAVHSQNSFLFEKSKLSDVHPKTLQVTQ